MFYDCNMLRKQWLIGVWLIVVGCLVGCDRERAPDATDPVTTQALEKVDASTVEAVEETGSHVNDATMPTDLADRGSNEDLVDAGDRPADVAETDSAGAERPAEQREERRRKKPTSRADKRCKTDADCSHMKLKCPCRAWCEKKSGTCKVERLDSNDGPGKILLHGL